MLCLSIGLWSTVWIFEQSYLHENSIVHCTVLHPEARLKVKLKAADSSFDKI